MALCPVAGCGKQGKSWAGCCCFSHAIEAGVVDELGNFIGADGRAVKDVRLCKTATCFRKANSNYSGYCSYTHASEAGAVAVADQMHWSIC